MHMPHLSANCADGKILSLLSNHSEYRKIGRVYFTISIFLYVLQKKKEKKKRKKKGTKSV